MAILLLVGAMVAMATAAIPTAVYAAVVPLGATILAMDSTQDAIRPSGDDGVRLRRKKSISSRWRVGCTRRPWARSTRSPRRTG